MGKPSPNVGWACTRERKSLTRALNNRLACTSHVHDIGMHGCPHSVGMNMCIVCSCSRTPPFCGGHILVDGVR